MTADELYAIFPQSHKGTAFISDLRLLVKSLSDRGYLNNGGSPLKTEKIVEVQADTKEIENNITKNIKNIKNIQKENRELRKEIEDLRKQINNLIEAQSKKQDKIEDQKPKLDDEFDTFASL